MDVRASDEMLRLYLLEASDADAERRLAELLECVAAPLVRRIVAGVMRDASYADVEDLVSDTLLHLLRRLRDFRADDANPITDLRRYIVTCAYNRCHERLRAKFPARNRLRNQLRYLCSHNAELTLSRNALGELVCGVRGHVPASTAPLRLQSDPHAENRAQTAALVPRVLRENGGPMTLDALAAEIARLIGLQSNEDDVEFKESVPGCTSSPATAFEERMSLQQLWDDVRALSLKQRIALLLNLRDAHGAECLSLLPLTRTATIPEIAEVVGMGANEFGALWSELPLNDAAIAKMLGATPRQVIKLRRLARERLQRMAKYRRDRNVRPDLDSTSSGITISTRR